MGVNIKNWHIVSLVVVCLVGVGISTLYRQMDALMQFGVVKKTSLNDHSCSLLNTDDGPFSSEDLAHIGHGLFLVADGDLAHGFGGKRFSGTHPGAIFVVDLASNVDAPLSQQIRKVKLDKMPKDLLFKPHGIYYSETRSRLYAISHGFGRGGERIFIFSVIASPHAENRIESVSLVFERAIFSPEINGIYGTWNDIAEGSEYGELYITQWTQGALPADGQHYGNTTQDTINDILNHLALIGPGRSVVHRCVFKRTMPSPGSDDVADCTVAASGFSMANGISVCESRKNYWVADMRSVHELVRENDGTLRRVKEIPVPHVIDNLEWDPQEHRLNLGVIPYILPAIKAIDNGVDSVQVAGGLHTLQRNAGKFTSSEDIVLQDGDKLNMISAAFQWNSRVLMGSPFSPGVLRCELSQ